MTHEEDAINKVVLRTLQMCKDELRFSVEKRQEEMKTQAMRIRNVGSVHVRKGQRPFTPVWKSCASERQANKKKQNKTALSERRGRWEFDLEGKEDEVQVEVSRAIQKCFVMIAIRRSVTSKRC